MQPTENPATIGSKMRGVADRDTPLLRNYWYVAAFAEEITRTPMRRTILNEDIVFYRTQDGKAVAVQNRCPHRSFPLHKGFLKGDRIVCNYHGIEFNPDGSCGLIPALNTAPTAIRLDSYPLEEDGPLVWIWMGDADAPDLSGLPRREWTNSPDWSYAKGYMYLKANYLGLHENLMDFTHFAFLHAKWNAAPPEAISAPVTVVEEDHSISINEVHVDVFQPPELVEASGMTPPFNREAYHGVTIPGMHDGREVIVDSSSPPKRDLKYVQHMMTPESATTTHYFWAFAYSSTYDGTAVPAMIQMIGEGAFGEDKEALEDIEEMWARDHRPGFREKILKTDEGGIRLLRMFNRLAEEEQRQNAQAVAAE